MISEGPFTLRIEYPLFPVNRSSITPMKTTVQFHFRTESGGFLFAIKFHADSLNGLILKLPSVLFTRFPARDLPFPKPVNTGRQIICSLLRLRLGMQKFLEEQRQDRNAQQK